MTEGGRAARGLDANGRAMLTVAILAALVGLFVAFYAAAERGRLARIVEEEAERARVELARKRAPLVPLGELIYQAHCSECHGVEGEGGRKAPALRSMSFLEAASDELLADAIRNGRPKTDMRPWGRAHDGPFGEDEIEALVAFLRAWEAGAPSGEADPRARK